MWSNLGNSKSIGLFPGRKVLGPLALMVLPAPVGILHWYFLRFENGNLYRFLAMLVNSVSEFTYVYDIWPSWRDGMAWKMIAVFMIAQLTLMKLVPGKLFLGPMTATGHVPKYKANGFQCFVLSILLYVGGGVSGFYNGGIIYDKLGEVLSALTVFSFGFCFMLYVKGKYYPSTEDHGGSGNFIFDYYWGMELYPRILGFDVKVFTNCRCGMMFWGISIIAYAWKQYELYGYVANSMMVSVALQLVYVAKFFYWETGYFRSMDIMHDRAGYYICWGCLVWVPSMYTSPAMYLTNHPIQLNPWIACTMFAAGLASVFVNYWADEQRASFRRLHGKCTIWGKPATYITATYQTDKKDLKTNLLLTCGFWGLSRHFHYIPEILAAFLWTLPCLFQGALPYFYVTFLTILLLDRANRDDARCKSKYGKHWDKYCKMVPNLILPAMSSSLKN